jgi:hypothetical protein
MHRWTAAGISRGLALLMLLVFVAHWRMVDILVRQLFVNPLGILALLTAGYVVLQVVSIVGLFRGRPWGFYAVYLMIPLTHLLLGIAFVPFVARAFPFPASAVVAAVGNATVLLLTVVAHVRYRRERDGGRRGAG